MPNQRLLYLTPYQMTAHVWRAGTLHEEAGFDAEAASSDFRDYLAAHSGDLFTLVVNVAEEGFQLETIPFLQRQDREVVVRRRLGQLFLGATLSTAVSLGYEKNRRKDERLLLAALTNNAFFEPWITALKAAEARVTAVYSLPLLSGTVLKKLGIQPNRAVLVTLQDNSLRQTFFDHGHLAFSRVSPLTNSSIAGIAQAIVSEAGKLQQYLLTQRLIGRADALTAHVLLHPAGAESIATALQDTDTLHFQPHNLTQLAKDCGLKTAPEDHRAQNIFLQIAAQHAPKHQFAGAALRREYRLWQLGNALRASGIVIIAGCLLIAAKTFVDTRHSIEEATLQQQQATDDERRYQAIAATFPPVPVSNDVLRQLVERYDSIVRQGGSPDVLLQHVGRSLDASPQIEIDTLGWAAPGATTPSERGSAATANDRESLQIRGKILLSNGGNPRQLLATFDRFVADLKRGEHVEVQIQQQPFDVGSGKSLRSDEGTVNTNAPRSFALTLTRRVGS